MIWFILAGCGRDCPTVDADGDGSPAACPGETATADGFIDCDDTDSSARPGAPEVCDGADNDCDGIADDGLSLTYYLDEDGDGYGNLSIEDCEAPDGYIRTGGDCDDADAAIGPHAEEVCDGIDNDCDGTADGGGDQLWYADADGDGSPSEDDPIQSCEAPAGYLPAADAWDCDDNNAAVSPDLEEICDGLDNDCNGTADEDVSSTWYTDADGDGLGGNTATNGPDCSPPAGYSLTSDDCDDSDASVGVVFPDPLDGDGVISGIADIADLCPCYTEISGSLRIRNVADTTDLSGLSCIELAEGLLISENDSLTSLEGLDGLQVIEGSVLIQDNPLLSSVTGISALTDIDGTLNVTDNAALADLSGFESLITIGGALTLADNDAMTGIGLDALETLGELSISSCPALTSVSGMSSLVEVEDDVSIAGCGALTTIDLPALTTVGGDLYLYNNAALADLSAPQMSHVLGELRLHWAADVVELDGLSGVRLVGKDLVVWGNAALSDVTGMHTVEQIGGDLIIQSNPDLATEDAESMRDAIGADNIKGTTTINNNG